MLSSCMNLCKTKVSKPHRKVLHKTRKDLRTKYHYHQTKVGRILNFNQF